MTIKNKLMTLLVGIYFGIVLIKSQVISWFQINDMFYFKDPYMYLVICSAIAVGAVSVFLIRRFEARTIEGAAIVIEERPFHPRRWQCRAMQFGDQQICFHTSFSLSNR